MKELVCIIQSHLVKQALKTLVLLAEIIYNVEIPITG